VSYKPKENPKKKENHQEPREGNAPSARAPATAQGELWTKAKGKEERGHPRKEEREGSQEASQEFERFWTIYPKRDGTNPRKPAESKFRSLVEHKVSPEVMIRGAQRYADSVADMEGPERRYIMQAITFLNQEGWRDEYRKPEGRPSFRDLAEELRGNGHDHGDDDHSPAAEFDLDLPADAWSRMQ
jgi:hypothetical protein